ncbi:hypothetical protein AE02_01342, partial [Klebsiella variicola]
GQAWSVPPFSLTERDGRYYGRGSADMKGFLAVWHDAKYIADQIAIQRQYQRYQPSC